MSSKANRNSPPAVLLRESFRAAQGQGTLANLSAPGAGRGLARAAQGRRRGVPPRRRPTSFALGPTHVAAVLGTLRKLRLDRMIAGADSPERRRVLALISPGSIETGDRPGLGRGDRARLARRDAGAGRLRRGRSLRRHGLAAQRDAIERRLAKRHLEDGALVLYDLTSVWLEGRRCPLGRRGYSRDGKRGKLQIEFGLLCDADGGGGVRRQHRGPGHRGRADRQACGIFGFSRVVLVGDRGMLTEARIREEVRPSGLDWKRVAGSGGAVPGGIRRGAIAVRRDRWWRSEPTPIRASASWCAAIRCWRRSGRASGKSCSGPPRRCSIPSWRPRVGRSGA